MECTGFLDKAFGVMNWKWKTMSSLIQDTETNRS